VDQDQLQEAHQILDRLEALIPSLRKHLADTNPPKSKPTGGIFYDPDWPLAVPASKLEVRTYSDRMFQALNTLTGLAILPHKKKVLDYGCGDGFLTSEISTAATLTVGYDKVADNEWDEHRKQDNMKFTTNWDEVVDAGPYDIIVAYDVVDHAPDALAEMNTVLNDNGQIYAITHPWTSRDGGHLHTQEGGNKAYLHLAYSRPILRGLGFDVDADTWNVVERPLAYYTKMIKQAGLFEIERQVVHSEIEPFIKDKLLTQIIANVWSDDAGMDREQALKILSISSIKYVLSKKPKPE